MSEGVATAVNDTCNQWTIDEIASTLYRERKMPTIAMMRRRFRTGGYEGMINYLTAASLVRFIDKRYGRSRLRELWQSGGMGGVQRVLGVSVLTLEKAWRNEIGARRGVSSWSVMSRTIEAEGCE